VLAKEKGGGQQKMTANEVTRLVAVRQDKTTRLSEKKDSE